MRIRWDEVGDRRFEAGVDRGVLYVDGNPGVPWLGLIGVEQSRSGGDPKPRYLDGFKISNHAEAEEFEGNIEAYSYPLEFEPCDGIAKLEHGLRVTRQRRKPFSMVYRTLVGNPIDDLTFGYKLHILYNLRAEPSNRKYPSLSERVNPTTFSWNVSARPPKVEGVIPSAHYVVDSREAPAELLTTLENLLYGTATTDPELPTAGELIFMFDSFLDNVYDAGSPLSPVFLVHDAGGPDTPVTLVLDGGAL